MKLDNKTINIVAGVIFLLQVFSNVTNTISQVVNGTIFHISPLRLVMHLFEIIVFSVIGISALRQKKRGKLLNGCGIVCFGYAIVNLLTAFPYSLNIRTIIPLSLMIAAFILSQKACGGSVFNTADTASEAAKIQIQAQKQTTIYDEQLRDGILTQEEYDQIMKTRK